MKATWIRLLKRAKGGRVKSSDACVRGLLSLFTWKSVSFVCVCVCVHLWFVHRCFLCASIYQSAALGSLWHGYVLPGDDETVGGVISYGCQILGSAPYHLPVTYWDSVLYHASSLTRVIISAPVCSPALFKWKKGLCAENNHIRTSTPWREAPFPTEVMHRKRRFENHRRLIESKRSPYIFN